MLLVHAEIQPGTKYTLSFDQTDTVKDGWDQPLQAEWIEEVYKIALGKPFISSVTYSDLADGDNNELPGSGLLKEDLSTKKAFLTMAKLQKFILQK